jgi:AcrR family transcriptional regulator
MTTDERLIAAASDLLDLGGESAVTLRAVAAATELSHNAPYKHFRSRDALLAAVAAQDFRTFRSVFEAAGQMEKPPLMRLIAALDDVVAFAERHRGRYRLLLSNPSVALENGELQAAADDAFNAFTPLVASCQRVGDLPGAPSGVLAGIIFATMHGLIDAQSSGRLQEEPGFQGVRSRLELFMGLLGGNVS